MSTSPTTNYRPLNGQVEVLFAQEAIASSPDIGAALHILDNLAKSPENRETANALLDHAIQKQISAAQPPARREDSPVVNFSIGAICLLIIIGLFCLLLFCV
jgi:hypothetical protein